MAKLLKILKENKESERAGGLGGKLWDTNPKLCIKINMLTLTGKLQKPNCNYRLG